MCLEVDPMEDNKKTRGKLWGEDTVSCLMDLQRFNTKIACQFLQDDPIIVPSHDPKIFKVVNNFMQLMYVIGCVSWPTTDIENDFIFLNKFLSGLDHIYLVRTT